MRKKFFAGLATGLFLVGMVATANATIVNIDAHNSNNAVSLFLEAGTYDIEVIGVADGGTYNAWDAWGNGTRWLNSYSFYSDEFGEHTISDGIYHGSALLALDNAIDSSFVLSSAANVAFYILDNPYNDNQGGMSLNVTGAPIPEPATMCLFGVGLVGIAGSRLRKKRK